MSKKEVEYHDLIIGEVELESIVASVPSNICVECGAEYIPCPICCCNTICNACGNEAIGNYTFGDFTACDPCADLILKNTDHDSNMIMLDDLDIEQISNQRKGLCFDGLPHPHPNDGLDMSPYEEVIGTGSSDNLPQEIQNTWTGFCRFCGQANIVTRQDSKREFLVTTQDLANEASARECSCSEGYDYRKVEERRENKAKELAKFDNCLSDLDIYFKYFYKQKNVDGETIDIGIHEELRQHLRACAEQILDNQIHKSSCEYRAIKMTVSLEKDDKLTLEYKYTNKAKSVC